MFNERGMTSRQPFGSRLSVVLEEGSADTASAGSEPMGRFGKAFAGSDVPARDRRPGTARISCLHIVSLLMSLVPLWAKPQGAVAAEGRAGTGEAWPCAWPQPGARSHTLLLRGTLPGEAATSPEWERTCQPLPCHGLWSCDTKPGLSWGQVGRVGVRS